MGHGCDAHRLDFFVTRPAQSAGPVSSSVGQIDTQYTADSKFCCSVVNIEPDPQTPTEACVVSKAAGSEWLLPRFPGSYDSADLLDPAFEVPYRDVKAGDVVRVGSAHTGGYTDYLTVLEVRDFATIVNTTGVGWPMSDGLGWGGGAGAPTVLVPGTSSPLANLSRKGIRVNKRIDCTSLPTWPTDATHGNALAAQVNITQIDQNQGSPWLSNPGKWFAETTPTLPTVVAMNAQHQEQFFYPLYRVIPWRCTGPDSELKLSLNTGGKKLHSLTLHAYAFSVIGDPGLHNDQDRSVIGREYYSLSIRELVGDVVQSNNSHVDGAFAVVYVGTAVDNASGTQEYRDSHWQPHGLATARFRTPLNVGSLTLELRNRRGEAAQLGHAHFWLSGEVTD